METKKVTLPSGQEVTIKKPGILAYKRAFGSIPILTDGHTGQKADPERDLDATISLICACSVEPRYTDEDPVPEGRESIDNLDLQDFAALSEALQKFMGLGEETEAVRPLSETATP